ERLKTWPDAPKGRTRREIIALRRGLPVFRGWGSARAGLSESEVVRRAETLPAPTFDAGRPPREGDELETSGGGSPEPRDNNPVATEARTGLAFVVVWRWLRDPVNQGVAPQDRDSAPGQLRLFPEFLRSYSWDTNTGGSPLFG